MPQQSHKHHYIPVFYLRQWTGQDGKLVAWSRPRRDVIPHRRHPQAVAYQEDLYAFKDLPDGISQWFEDQFLSQVDDLAARALLTMEGERTTQLDNVLRSAWARFATILFFRHPDVVRELTVIVKAAWDKTVRDGRSRFTDWPREDRGFETYDEYLSSLTEEANARIHASALKGVMDNEVLGNRLMKMAWQVFDFPGADFDFLTSDWPAVLALTADPPHLFFPLSPKSLFVASERWDVFQRVLDAKPNEVVRGTNQRTVERARRFVFSTDEKQASFIRKRMSTAMAQSPFFPSAGLEP